MIRISPGLWLGLCVWLSLSSCREVTTQVVSDPVRDAAVRDASAADAGRKDSGRDAQVVGPARCGGRACACDDGKDNDKDGLIDGLDAECTGPFDDDERSFAAGKASRPGPCRDCYWDQNAGGGDDQCAYPQQCLRNEPLPPNACGGCEVPEPCRQGCLPYTPNGCDCFGCCQITRADGSMLQIELNDDCAMDKLDDVKACPRCVVEASCQNACGRCELCVGKTAADLPVDCTQDATASEYACDDGQQVCGSTQDCTGVDMYCQLGCCLPILL